MSALTRRPLLLAAACWVAFAGVLASAYAVPLTMWADGWAVRSFRGMEKPGLESIAAVTAHLADPLPFALATLVLAGIAIARGRPRHAVGVVFLLIGANVTSQVLKVVLAHTRAHEFLGDAQIAAAAFPSGHATASMSLAFAAVLVAPAVWRPTVAVVGALFSLGVSESILLLAWHFPSDVFGGYLVATSFACLTVAGLHAAQARWPERTGREAARRALGRASLGRTLTAFAALGTGAGVTVAIARGERALDFANRNTTVVLVILGVAAMAATLPPAIAALSARRA
jgi:membrane-associated phospholipid phosphatase